jgi:phage gpG-like protein
MIRTKVSREKSPNIEARLNKANASMLDSVGAYLEKEMTHKIDIGLRPALLPSTIESKGSSKPLFDTGELYDQISHEASGDTVEIGVIGSRASIAKHHEFGAPRAHIPERSFIRSAVSENKRRVGRVAEESFR